MSKNLLNILITFVICMILPLGDFYFRLSLFLFVVELIRFIKNENIVPIKEITSLLMALQLLLAPAIIYNFFENNTSYPMWVDNDTYFKYVIPAYLLILLGLYGKFWKKKHDFIDFETLISPSNFGKGLILFAFSIISSVFYLISPPSLFFVIILFNNLIFVSVFYIFFSTFKYRNVLIIIIYFLWSIKIIAGGVFINLFIWSFFVYSLFAFRYKFSIRAKLIILISAFSLAFLVQSFKQEYREEISYDNNGVEFEIFVDMAYDRVSNLDELLSKYNFDKYVSRLNQGWILSHIMDRMPRKAPFAHGSYLFEELKGILLPRLISSNKAVVGSHDKFLDFTGIQLGESPAMNVGLFGDGYGNFGFTGGLIFSFLFGLLINYALLTSVNLSNKYPTLILWLPFIFFYVMRAGNEFYIIFNWVVKSSILVWGIFIIFRKYFIVKPQVKNV